MHLLRRLFVSVTLTACACALLPAQDRFAELARVAEQVRAEIGSPGLSIALELDGKLVWSNGFGLADMENQIPARANTVYRIASISKTFGATAVLQLMDAGKVSVDDAITKYVPGFRQQVTLRQIMTHTSGIRHYRGEPDNTVHFSSLADAITIFRDDPLLFEPGTKVQYSSYAYNLLAGVIETASGRSLEEYLEKSIFARPRALRKRRWTTTTVSFQTAPDFTSAKPMGCKMRRMWTTASSGLAAGCSLPPKT